MKAGFACVNINPAVGTRMTGFGTRDRSQPCMGIHDDVYVRALYLAHEGGEALIMGFDLLFFSRDEADRFKGAIGRRLDIRPSGILLNTSHRRCLQHSSMTSRTSGSPEAVVTRERNTSARRYRSTPFANKLAHVSMYSSNEFAEVPPGASTRITTRAGSPSGAPKSTPFSDRPSMKKTGDRCSRRK